MCNNKNKRTGGVSCSSCNAFIFFDRELETHFFPWLYKNHLTIGVRTGLIKPFCGGPRIFFVKF